MQSWDGLRWESGVRVLNVNVQQPVASIMVKATWRAYTTMYGPALDRNSPFRSRTPGPVFAFWGDQDGNQTSEISGDWLTLTMLKLTRRVAETPRSRGAPHSGILLSFKL